MCLPAAPAEGNRGGQGRRYASAECPHLGRSTDGCGCPSGGRAGLVRPAYVERLLAEHEKRQADHSFRLYALLALHLWLEQWGKLA